MTRCSCLLLLLALLVSSQAVFSAIKSTVDVSTIKELETALSKVEDETIATSGFDKKRVFGITFPYQGHVAKTSVGQGKKHTLYPAAMVKVITDLLKQGKDKKEIGQILVEYDQNGKLAKIAH
ncbi:MAG: hypothetical protein HYU64_16525 [Armatimonadetes bacterium]|nr:hypothetical protein [Armatimonadota bacterium]